MNHNVKNIVIIVVFVLVIVVPIFMFRLVGGDYSEAEKRILSNVPVIFTDDGNINPDLGSQFQNWFDDHIGLRSEMVNMYGNVKFNLLNQSPSDQVHIGKDGWYYYTLDENLQIATGDYTLTDEILAQILENHLIIRDKLAERGIEYLIVMPTSKVSIYPEYMRYGNGEIRETPVDIVADYLEANSDLRVVRLKEALLDAKKDTQVYFKTDTHWNQAGAYVGYREIISKMNEWGLCEDDPIDISFEDSSFTGEFGDMMGISLPQESTKNVVLPYQNALKNPQTDRYSIFSDAVSVSGVLNPCYFYSNSMVNGPKVMMYGDSMFGIEWNVRELLAEHFVEFSYIWNYNINNVFIDAMEPDIVIYEMTERYLNSFSTYYNYDFIHTTLNDCNSEIVNVDWEGSTLTATVRNTGGSTWYAVNLIRLGVFADGIDTGMRADISKGQRIKPGETVSFAISFDTHPDLLEKKLDVTMLQEGIQYFGEKKRVIGEEDILNAVVVSNTAPTTVKQGDVYSFEITVQNTGTQEWNENSMIRLCIWQDEQDWGYRNCIPEGITVASGEMWTFVQEGFVVQNTEKTVLEFQMLQEGICYFGEKERVEISAPQ